MFILCVSILETLRSLYLRSLFNILIFFNPHMALTSVSTKYFLHILYTNLEKKKKLISTYQNIIEDLEFLEGQAVYVFRDTH